MEVPVSKKVISLVPVTEMKHVTFDKVAPLKPVSQYMAGISEVADPVMG
jgi:hypothetical protein